MLQLATFILKKKQPLGYNLEYAPNPDWGLIPVICWTPSAVFCPWNCSLLFLFQNRADQFSTGVATHTPPEGDRFPPPPAPAFLHYCSLGIFFKKHFTLDTENWTYINLTLLASLPVLLIWNHLNSNTASQKVIDIEVFINTWQIFQKSLWCIQVAVAMWLRRPRRMGPLKITSHHGNIDLITVALVCHKQTSQMKREEWELRFFNICVELA